MKWVARALMVVLLLSSPVLGEDRSIDGSGNNKTALRQGASNELIARITYPNVSGQLGNDRITLVNPRDVSNAVSKQTQSLPSARGLSDYVWVWGQFLAHDMSLSLSSAGPEANGTAPIAVSGRDDPLGPNPIPFTRSDFVPSQDAGIAPVIPLNSMDDGRENINLNTSYIDASVVYGSTKERSDALRTDDGNGAFLLIGDHNLLPRNTMGLPNEDVGRLTNEEQFVAGDLRANEHPLLLSMHTVFMREHNRLAALIEERNPEFSAEETYQLARKIVGAEVQAITYNEFLPALMGEMAPRSSDFQYSPHIDATITQSFSHAINRWGHSATSPQLQLVGDQGQSVGHVELRDVFANSEILGASPEALDQLLRGAASQLSQEIDVYVVDDLRNFLFGPPGAGGLDLAALNIQRGRDHGIPPYVFLQLSYEIRNPATSFNEVTANSDIQAALAKVYGNVSDMDAWIAALAEDHLAGSSFGALTTAVTQSQFNRLRDGDRLFYLSNDAGLYENGELKSDVRSLVDLDAITLASVIEMNTEVQDLQENVFFAAGLPSGDFNRDGIWDCFDLSSLSFAKQSQDLEFDMNGDGLVNDADISDDTFGWNTIGRSHRDQADIPCVGDFDGDGIVDVADIDLLSAKVRAGENETEFDLNGDGTVTLSDHSALIAMLGVAMGDTNLDGIVNFADFLSLSVNFGQSGGWAEGDFDATRTIDFADFLLVSQNFGAGPTAVRSVPEPATNWPLAVCVIGLATFRRTLDRRRN